MILAIFKRQLCEIRKKKPYEIFKDKVHATKMLIFVGLLLFFVFPLVWIVLVSVQPADVAFTGNYRLIPKNITLDSYNEIFLHNNRGIRDSLLYSLVTSIISAVLAMMVAICALYVVMADTLSGKVKTQTIQISVGLYFLPAFAVIAGLDLLSRFVTAFRDPSLVLVLTHSVFGYVISFVLLLFLFLGKPEREFEQLLLETGSRWKAFLMATVGRHYLGTLVIFGLTTATVWSEFFLSAEITATNQLKPFSVVLQMAQGQYDTSYSVFAAGAAISMFVFLALTCILPVILSGCVRLLTRFRK